MVYRYTAYTLDKRIVQGVIDATSESAAEEALYQAGHRRVLRLAEIRPGLSLPQLIPTLFGVKTQDVIDFSRQLATLIESGVNILTALQLLEGQSNKSALRKVIAGLIEELRGGSPLSQALGKYPEAFPDTYCQVIRASEQTGNLEASLRQIAGYMEKRMAVKKKVTRAMAYPTVVLLMAIGVVAILVTVVLPPLAKLFASLGAALPSTTRVVIFAAGFFIDYKLHLLGGLFAVIILIAGYVRLPAGKLTMDRLMLRMPVIGSINIQRNMHHFCETTAILLKAGLLLPQILSIVIQTVGNRVVRQALGEVREKLIQGEGLSGSMGAIDLFPPLLVEMILVGEKSGSVESTLDTLAEYYEQRVDQRIGTLTSMMEPALIMAIGLMTAFIALSIITPLYSIMRSIQ